MEQRIDRERLRKLKEEEREESSRTEASFSDAEGREAHFASEMKHPRHEEDPKEKKPKRGKAGSIILFAAVLLILLAAVLFKVFMNTSYKPTKEFDISKHPGLNLTISDNSIELRNPNQSTERGKIGIIFYSDLRVEGECYLPLMAELSKMGYDCFLPRSFGNQPYLNTEGAYSIIRKYPRIAGWILVGHSHSCNTAAFYASGNEELLDGLVYLGGFSTVDLSGRNLPLLSIVGSEDTVVDGSRLEQAKKNDPDPAQYEVIKGANNSGFLDSELLSGDQKASLSSEEQIRLSADLIHRFVLSNVE